MQFHFEVAISAFNLSLFFFCFLKAFAFSFLFFCRLSSSKSGSLPSLISFFRLLMFRLSSKSVSFKAMSWKKTMSNYILTATFPTPPQTKKIIKTIFPTPEMIYYNLLSQFILLQLAPTEKRHNHSLSKIYFLMAFFISITIRVGKLFIGIV